MADDNKSKLNIRLHVYDEEMNVTISDLQHLCCLERVKLPLLVLELLPEITHVVFILLEHDIQFIVLLLQILKLENQCTHFRLKFNYRLITHS